MSDIDLFRFSSLSLGCSHSSDKMSRFLSLLTLSLSVSFALAYPYPYKNFTGGSSLEEARQKIWSSIRDRSRLSALKDGPVDYTRHIEVDHDSCSHHCQKKSGDGRCNPECYTRGCLYDFGDCPSRPYRPCKELLCNPSRCDNDCFFAGCPTSCDFESGYYKEFIFVFSPYISPANILEKYPLIERNIEEQTGLKLSLQMLWGMVEGEKHEPYGILWPIYPRRLVYNESVAIFGVESGHVDPKDKETLQVLKRLGTEEYFAQVTPIILAEPQYSRFEPFALSYNDERLKQEAWCAKTGTC